MRKPGEFLKIKRKEKEYSLRALEKIAGVTNPKNHERTGRPSGEVSFIEKMEPYGVGTLIKHIGEETQRAPPLSLTTVSVNEPDSWYGDYIPPDDVYFRDEEYAY